MARLPTMAAATGCERSTMPCLMAVTCTLSTTITVSTPVGAASSVPMVASAVELSSVAGYFPNVACPAFPACPPIPAEPPFTACPAVVACSAAPACTSVSACPWVAARTAAVPTAGRGADVCLPAAADRSGSSRNAMNSCLRCTIRRLIQLQSNGIISEAAILICEEALRVRRLQHIRPSWRRSPARRPSVCPAFP